MQKMDGRLFTVRVKLLPPPEYREFKVLAESATRAQDEVYSRVSDLGIGDVVDSEVL